MKIALSAFSFHTWLLAGRMRQEDVPAAAAALGFDAVEMLDLLAAPLPAGRWTGWMRRGWQGLRDRLPLLPESPLPLHPKQYSPDIARPLRVAADQAGVRVIAWTMDTDLTVTGEALVEQRAYWARGIAVARALGAEVLRVTSGGRAGARSLLTTTQQNLSELVEMASGLRVAVENHHGLSGDPELLATLLDRVPGAGCCLDFGNFAPRLRNVAVCALAPYAVHVHAKSYDFDARGNERSLPYPAFIRALEAAGYSGWYVVEYEGNAPPLQGIEQTRSLLERRETVAG